MTDKLCSKCQQTKLTTDFSPNRYGPQGLDWHCKACKAANEREKRLLHPEKYKTKEKRWYDDHKEQHIASTKRRKDADPEKYALMVKFVHVKKKYGLSKEQYYQMIEDQNSKCAICGVTFDDNDRKSSTCVDHDHKTGKVRALLCHNCNIGIAKFSESSIILQSAIDYLASF